MRKGDRLKIIYLIVWIVLIGYTFLLAPGVGIKEYDLVKDILMFNEVDPLIISIFYLFGVWPFIFAGLLFKKKSANINAWPFVIGSFIFGVFALLPYYFLNGSGDDSKHTKEWLKSYKESKLVYLILIIITTWLLLYGLMFGDPNGFITMFNYSWFVHIMGIDFILLVILSIITMYKQGATDYKLGFIPVLGPLIYLLREANS
ncbi:hypothetical protein [Haloplasma contractile]|uniref:Uncharacterized protein n=1 Tax=Haloplasma contractile SSD-17B TaxID=1033810 RepID=U2FFJ8_9MOLU|nr:hypothetical protein [Haloplasma contractile]ERJ11690.1 hypothetical protein HLPCO_002173 [Haloplasma contractile SSD-17B]